MKHLKLWNLTQSKAKILWSSWIGSCSIVGTSKPTDMRKRSTHSSLFGKYAYLVASLALTRRRETKTLTKVWRSAAVKIQLPTAKAKTKVGLKNLKNIQISSS